MRILHLIQRYPPAVGGSEAWCRDAARHQARCGHQVRVLTLDIIGEQEFWSEPEGEAGLLRLGHLDLDHGVEIRRFRRTLPIWSVHHLLFRQVLDRLFDIFFLGPHSVEMTAHLEKEMEWADVVHLHTLPYPHVGIGLWAARRAGKRTVITPHFHPGHREYERHHQRAWLARADAVIAVSAHEKRLLAERGVQEDRIFVSANGLPPDFRVPADREACRRRLREHLGLGARTRIIVCVARKTAEKGIGALLDALGLLLAERRDVALVLIGPTLPWFEQAARQLPPAVQSRLFDLGTLSDEEKGAALAGSDLFAMPSLHEAFGIVFLEAWAAGLPVIGGRSGAQPEVIGDAGKTVPFGDARATAAAIRSYLDDPAAARRAAARGRVKVETLYRWDRIGTDLLKVYRSVTGRRELRILYGSNFYPPHFQGGAELALAMQARGLAAHGHAVRVLAGRLDPSAPRHAVAIEEGPIPVDRITLHPQDLSAEFGNHVNPAAEEAFGRVIDRFGPDVVHLHNVSGLGVGLISVARERNLPVVMTLHDYWGYCLRNTLVRTDGAACPGPGAACSACLPVVGGSVPIPPQARNLEVMEALRRVTLFLAPSRYLMERLVGAGLPAERVHLLPYGVDRDRFPRVAAAQAGAPFLFLGYLGRHKGPQVILEALAEPAAAGLRCLIAGDGWMRGELERLAARLGVADRVRLLGQVPPERIPGLLAECSALVLPSLWPENAPLTITEAMAAGRPVIASAMGGIPEMVEDGRTGILVPAGDAQALAGAMARVASGDGGSRLGEAGREAVASQELPEIIQRLEKIYRSLLDRPVREWDGPAVPRVAIAGDAGAWGRPEMGLMLAAAETRCPRFSVEMWREESGAAAAGARGYTGAGLGPSRADVLVLADEGDLAAAAGALARGIPFVARARGASALGRLAADSGAGDAVQDPVEAGRRLGDLLADEGLRRRRSEAARVFTERLTRSPRTIGHGAPRHASTV